MSTPKFCSNCGAPLAEGAKFCAECGTPVASAEAAAPSEPTPEPEAEVKAEPAPEPEAEVKAEPAPEPTPEPAPAPAADASEYKDPVAALLAAGDDDDDEIDLADGDEPVKKGLPVGAMALAGFATFIIGGALFIGTNEELSARFRCQVLNDRGACITKEDKIWAIEQQAKKEEMELMTHHYGAFDLSFTPETDASFTLIQKRYEESRDDFVKRIREGAEDKRTFKEKKVGVYSTGKSVEGVIKGRIKFSTNPPSEITFQPEQGKQLVLPLSLADLPLLEREQVDGNGKRLTAEDVTKLEKERDQIGPEARKDPRFKVKTQALSSWIYEIQLSAKGYKPRSVVFFEPPLPPDIDRKKMETEQKVTFRPFARRPDGKFVIENATFDMLPEPRTLWTRYIQAQKEIYLLAADQGVQGARRAGPEGRRGPAVGAEGLHA